MQKLHLTSNYRVLPEGEQILRIYDVKFDETYGTLEVFLVNARGITHKERYQVMNNDGETNDKAMSAFSYLANCALDSDGDIDIDPTELIDKYVKAEVYYNEVPSKKDPSKMMTFAHLGRKEHADGFDTEAVPAALNLKPSKYNLDDVLNS